MGVFFPWGVLYGFTGNRIVKKYYQNVCENFWGHLKIIIFIKTMTILFSYYFQGKIGLSFYFALDYNE